MNIFIGNTKWIEETIKEIKGIMAITGFLTSNNMEIKLEQAVREEVARQSGEFSIYDITLNLRKQVNDRIIKIEGLNYEYLQNGLYGFNLPHAEVRATFYDLQDELGVEVVNQGRFITFKLSDTDDDGVVNKISVGKQVVTGAVNVSTLVTGVAQFEDKIVNYLENKGSATLAQIQSRLKTKGITCGDLCKFLEGLDGVEVKVSGHISKSVARSK